MRRKNFGVILFLVAMAVQVIAPVMGGMARANARSPGEAISSLCRAAGGDTGEAPESPARHDSCALCEVLCDGVAPVGARDYAIVPAGNVWFALVWGSPEVVRPPTSIDQTHRARAPPSFS